MRPVRGGDARWSFLWIDTLDGVGAHCLPLALACSVADSVLLRRTGYGDRSIAFAARMATSSLAFRAISTLKGGGMNAGRDGATDTANSRQVIEDRRREGAACGLQVHVAVEETRLSGALWVDEVGLAERAFPGEPLDSAEPG